MPPVQGAKGHWLGLSFKVLREKVARSRVLGWFRKERRKLVVSRVRFEVARVTLGLSSSPGDFDSGTRYAPTMMALLR